MFVRRQSYLAKCFPFCLLIFFSYCTSDCSNAIYFASVINASVRLGLFDNLSKNVCIQVIDWTEWAFVLEPINNGFLLIIILSYVFLMYFFCFFFSVTKLRWLIKAMREKNMFCSLNIISCSHNLSFCSHKKDSLFPQYNILFPQLIILFPQERYFVLTTYYLVPSIYYFGVRRPYIVNCSFKNLLWNHGTHFPIIRTKLCNHSPWVVPLNNCVQQVRITHMMSSSGGHSLTLDPMV